MIDNSPACINTTYRVCCFCYLFLFLFLILFCLFFCFFVFCVLFWFRRWRISCQMGRFSDYIKKSLKIPDTKGVIRVRISKKNKQHKGQKKKSVELTDKSDAQPSLWNIIIFLERNIIYTRYNIRTPRSLRTSTYATNDCCYNILKSTHGYTKEVIRSSYSKCDFL